MKTNMHFFKIIFRQFLEQEMSVKSVGMAGHVNKHGGGGECPLPEVKSHVNNPLIDRINMQIKLIDLIIM
jgi:hypothetical protein